MSDSVYRIIELVGASEKVRIVVKGLRREAPVSHLCRREGMAGSYLISANSGNFSDIDRIVSLSSEVRESVYR